MQEEEYNTIKHKHKYYYSGIKEGGKRMKEVVWKKRMRKESREIIKNAVYGYWLV